MADAPSPRASFVAFIRAFGAHWFDYMSGAPSVPLAVAAIIYPNWSWTPYLWLTAMFCIVLSAYLVWRTERKRVIELEAVERLSDVVHMTYGGGVMFASSKEISGTEVTLGVLVGIHDVFLTNRSKQNRMSVKARIVIHMKEGVPSKTVDADMFPHTQILGIFGFDQLPERMATLPIEIDPQHTFRGDLYFWANPNSPPKEKREFYWKTFAQNCAERDGHTDIEIELFDFVSGQKAKARLPNLIRGDATWQ